MNRQEQLDQQWHDTGYEELGIGFNHEPTDPRTDSIPYDLSKPIAPDAALGTAKDNSIRMKREREERRARNLAAFNRDRLTVRA